MNNVRFSDKCSFNIDIGLSTGQTGREWEFSETISHVPLFLLFPCPPPYSLFARVISFRLLHHNWWEVDGGRTGVCVHFHAGESFHLDPEGIFREKNRKTDVFAKKKSPDCILRVAIWSWKNSVWDFVPFVFFFCQPEFNLESSSKIKILNTLLF